MDVMFDNAMAYNTPETVYHKQARSLKAISAKMVELAKQGVTDFRLAAHAVVNLLTEQAPQQAALLAHTSQDKVHCCICASSMTPL